MATTAHAIHSGQPPSVPGRGQDAAALVARVRVRVAEEILRLTRLAGEAEAAGRAGGARQLAQIRVLQQLVLALDDIGPGEMPEHGAGLGSRLALEDVATGESLECTLMAGDVDPGAGQVSLASPIGQALLGHGPGDVVEVVVPAGRRSFRLRSLATLAEQFGVGGRGRRASGRRASGAGSRRRDA